MHALLIAVVLSADPDAAAPTAVVAYPSAASAANALATVPTGTLLFSEGDCLAVKAFTGSPYTHVAAVVRDGEAVWVYDSQNGVGVRRSSLADYLDATRPDELRVYRPSEPFGDSAARRFGVHLDSQLGRPYAVTHHLTGDRCEGPLRGIRHRRFGRRGRRPSRTAAEGLSREPAPRPPAA